MVDSTTAAGESRNIDPTPANAAEVVAANSGSNVGKNVKLALSKNMQWAMHLARKGSISEPKRRWGDEDESKDEEMPKIGVAAAAKGASAVA